MKIIKRLSVFIITIILVVILMACGSDNNKNFLSILDIESNSYSSIADIPEFDGKTPFVTLNDNVPEFSDKDLVKESYESYSELDSLGRCGVAMACIGQDIMPTESRGSIGKIKPSGWHLVKYENVDGKYLYNRCHLIGYQLSGENANNKNLITGTRYLNVEGMLPFENMIADYVEKTDNHVLYRVTPIFEGDNLLASGVKMEAMSVEDKGRGISFNIYAYNAQPEIIIDYTNGNSKLKNSDDETASYEEPIEYILNTNSKKIHYPDCASVDTIAPKNKAKSNESAGELFKKGYTFCNYCEAR